MRRLLLPLVLAVAAYACATAVWPVKAQSGTSASLAGTTIHLKGLHNAVTVNYDSRAVPYIEAQNDDDLYFAQGYIVARDRLWQMDLIRRSSRGELAEIFGAVALEEDKIHRKYGFSQLADQIASTLAPKAQAAVIAYSQGVNAYIESLDDQSFPIEFRLLRYKPALWRPSDCVILGKTFAESLSTSWQSDIIRAAFSDVPEEKRQQIFPAKSSLDVILTGVDES
ncbi:MAG TPA: penicillin acylase family protein, partial [Blastocatellia bacterium]|nr:penicillin acylase family protein [Blastocatellia bacterium]